MNASDILLLCKKEIKKLEKAEKGDQERGTATEYVTASRRGEISGYQFIITNIINNQNL